jgi:glycosyltransferase involved in cell wall biosynthesis
LLHMARIFHLLDTLGIGGAEIMVASLARWQASRGHAVQIHGLQAGGPIAERIRAMQLPVSWHDRHGRAPTLYALYRQIRAFAPDVVHCHNLVPTLYGTLAARLAGVPCLLTTRHGLRDRSETAERRYWFAARWHRYVVAVSDAARANLASVRFADPAKLITVRNGADLPDTTPPDEELYGSGFTLVAVGRLVKAKGYEFLLEALALALREIPDLRLWLVGEGPERNALEQSVRSLGLESAVCFLGAQSNVGYWLQHADLFVVSSISEGLPISLLEAFAMGRAVVGTAVGGVPEAVEIARAGLIVPCRSPRHYPRPFCAWSETSRSAKPWRSMPAALTKNISPLRRWAASIRGSTDAKCTGPSLFGGHRAPGDTAHSGRCTRHCSSAP